MVATLVGDDATKSTKSNVGGIIKSIFLTDSISNFMITSFEPGVTILFSTSKSGIESNLWMREFDIVTNKLYQFLRLLVRSFNYKIFRSLLSLKNIQVSC